MAWAPFAAMGAGLLADKFMNNDKMKKVQTLSKPQQALLGQLMQMISPQGQVGQGYQGALGLQQQLMNPSSQAVSQFTQPYIDEYNQQTIPGLAERFAGYGGTGGGLSSSGFGQALSSAGGNLQAQLAQLKAGLGQQAAESLMSQYGQLSGTALNVQPFGYQQQAPSITGGMLSGWARGGFQGLQGFGKTGQSSASQTTLGANPYNNPYAAAGNPMAWRS